MIGRTTCATLVLSLALSAAASAATLFSRPLTPGDAANSLVCRITNVGSQPRSVTIEIFGFRHPSAGGTGDGNLIDSLSVIVEPLHTFSLSAPDETSPGVTPHICKFTAPGPKTGYRASACVVPTASNPSGGSPLACVPAD
jgi:hypothetical protein